MEHGHPNPPHDQPKTSTASKLDNRLTWSDFLWQLGSVSLSSTPWNVKLVSCPSAPNRTKPGLLHPFSLLSNPPTSDHDWQPRRLQTWKDLECDLGRLGHKSGLSFGGFVDLLRYREEDLRCLPLFGRCQRWHEGRQTFLGKLEVVCGSHYGKHTCFDRQMDLWQHCLRKDNFRSHLSLWYLASFVIFWQRNKNCLTCQGHGWCCLNQIWTDNAGRASDCSIHIHSMPTWRRLVSTCWLLSSHFLRALWTKLREYVLFRTVRDSYGAMWRFLWGNLSGLVV